MIFATKYSIWRGNPEALLSGEKKKKMNHFHGANKNEWALEQK